MDKGMWSKARPRDDKDSKPKVVGDQDDFESRPHVRVSGISCRHRGRRSPMVMVGDTSALSVLSYLRYIGLRGGASEGQADRAARVGTCSARRQDERHSLDTHSQHKHIPRTFVPSHPQVGPHPSPRPRSKPTACQSSQNAPKPPPEHYHDPLQNALVLRISSAASRRPSGSAAELNPVSSAPISRTTLTSYPRLSKRPQPGTEARRCTTRGTAATRKNKEILWVNPLQPAASQPQAPLPPVTGMSPGSAPCRVGRSASMSCSAARGLGYRAG